MTPSKAVSRIKGVIAHDAGLNSAKAMRIPRRKRRWLQVSLSTVLIVVAVLSIWLGMRANKARRQERAIERLSRLSSSIQFDYQFDEGGQFDPEAESPVPAWLRRTAGDDFFRRAIGVSLTVGVSDQILTHEWNATNEDLDALESLSDVKVLELTSNLQITDAGLVHLRSLDDLETLYLYRTGVRGPGLEHIVKLPRLASVALGNSPLADEGLAHIGKIKTLTWLRLDGTRITDHGLRHLSGLENLLDLSLSSTDVTDAGLDHLRELHKLEQLGLSQTNVTAPGIARLREALPNCLVSASFGLGVKPKIVTLWPAGHAPTRAEILTKIEEIGGKVQFDATRPEKPITYFMLFDSNLSDESTVALLGHLPELDRLNFRDVVLGDQFLESIGQFSKLRFLALGDSRVTDEGLKHLGALEHLEELDLMETRITDRGLEHLSQLRSLRQLNLSGTRVTSEGLYKLQQALPDCRISY